MYEYAKVYISNKQFHCKCHTRIAQFTAFYIKLYLIIVLLKFFSFIERYFIGKYCEIHVLNGKIKI